MVFLKKAKDIIVEYWEIFLAGVALLVGIVVGTSGNREKVAQGDADARKQASEDIQQGTNKAIKDYQKATSKNASNKKEKEEAADKKEEERKEELLNDSSKLDKVLKDKYNLKGG